MEEHLWRLQCLLEKSEFIQPNMLEWNNAANLMFLEGKHGLLNGRLNYLILISGTVCTCMLLEIVKIVLLR